MCTTCCSRNKTHFYVSMKNMLAHILYCIINTSQLFFIFYISLPYSQKHVLSCSSFWEKNDFEVLLSCIFETRYVDLKLRVKTTRFHSHNMCFICRQINGVFCSIVLEINNKAYRAFAKLEIQWFTRIVYIWHRSNQWLPLFSWAKQFS